VTFKPANNTTTGGAVVATGGGVLKSFTGGEKVDSGVLDATLVPTNIDDVGVDVGS